MDRHSIAVGAICAPVSSRAIADPLLVDDFRLGFGEDPGNVVSVGVMTDGDDLQADMETWYGDIRIEAA